MEKLLVFIPAYNCEKQVTRVLSQLLDQRIAPWVGECIVVNNRSADASTFRKICPSAGLSGPPPRRAGPPAAQ